MILYAVIAHFDYEGDDLRGVFSTLPLALEYMNSEDNATWCDVCTVREIHADIPYYSKAHPSRCWDENGKEL